MMDLARRHRIVPEDIFSKKERTAEDVVLAQVLAYDIAWQKRAPFIVASVDAVQCYDRIAHSIAALYHSRQPKCRIVLSDACLSQFVRCRFSFAQLLTRPQLV